MSEYGKLVKRLEEISRMQPYHTMGFGHPNACGKAAQAIERLEGYVEQQGLRNFDLEQKILGVRTELAEARAREGRHVEALEYYANHIHWMGLTEDAEFQTSFIAGKFWDMNGWSVAEKALAAPAPSKDSEGKE